MKKVFLFLFVAIATLSSCHQDLEDAIAALNDRVTALEDTAITTINEQITRINTSIADLKVVDVELKNYITTLQNTATELQESVNTTNSRIDEVKAALQGEISIAKADVLAQLEALKAETNNELKLVNAAIDTLKSKDVELENKITTLQTYVDTELKNTKDWASATFTTLEQYNALCAEVATIKTQIESLNNMIVELESRLNSKIATDIDVAVKGLQEELADSVKEITASYISAIAVAKDEITKAYTDDIKNAVSTLENSMKQWVNEQLANYYTIAQVDAKVDALSAEFEGKLSTQKIYLESLVSSLSQTLTNKITANSELIATLRNDLTSLDGEVAKNTEDIANNVEKISANAASIITNANSIIANGENDEENRKAIEANAVLIAENKQLIIEVENKIDNTSNTVNANAIANNAKVIAENSKAIAENAQLLAENCVAINNNANAIAANANEIASIKTTLTNTTTEITVAYTELINKSVNALDGKLDKSVATINARIDSEVSAINNRLDAIEARVETLENDIVSIKSAIASMQSEIAEMQEQIAALLARIQSVTYIPKYSDGKATMDYGTKEAELDFMISPKSAVLELTQLWNSALSVKAVYTKTRAVNFIDLPITSFEADADNGVVSIKVSGANLNDDFYVEQQEASLVLQISDGNSNISSEYVAMTSNFNIRFEDPHVKAICCSNWDTNYDGELSYEEAAAVTTIETCFNNKSEIMSFTELKYFTGITEIPSRAFTSSYRLTKIDFPSNVLTIGESAFSSCNSIIIQNFPEGLTSIGGSAFTHCHRLEEVVLPNNMTEVSDNLFNGCNSLTIVTIPNRITKIGLWAFDGCSKLTTVYCKPTTPPVKSQGIFGTPKNYFRIYVPRDSYDAYMNDWSEYKAYIEPYDFE